MSDDRVEKQVNKVHNWAQLDRDGRRKEVVFELYISVLHLHLS